MGCFIEILDIYGREILDSRGNPTVEVDVKVCDEKKNKFVSRASVPSGASKGSFEALELRDNEKRYLGLGVEKAVSNINNIISKKLIGMNALDQLYIDKKMIEIDGTKNKSNLGANSILGVSLAVAKASSKALNIPLYKYLGGFYTKKLPVPMMNILNGGKHADNSIDFQEFMIVPVKEKTFKEAVQISAEIYHNLKKVLKDKNLSTAVGDEGGFAPNIDTVENVIEIILKSIEKAGYIPYEDVYIALDIAATELYKDGRYYFKRESRFKETKNIISRTSEEMIEIYSKLIEKYPIISIEDGLSEEDWDGWKLMKSKLGDKVQLVGDDIFTTNLERLRKGIKIDVANSILIKLNQIGTLTETFEVIDLAKKNKMTTIISHRSGETEDTIIADIAVAVNSGQIKIGAPTRIDRIAKYNQLIRIEEELKKTSIYEGIDTFYNLKKNKIY